MLKPKYLRRLTLVVIALLTFLTISWYSTQAYSASPQKGKVQVVADSANIISPTKNVSLHPIRPRVVPKVKDTSKKFKYKTDIVVISSKSEDISKKWRNTNLGMKIGKNGSAKVTFNGGKDVRKDQVITTQPDPNSEFGLFSWPCQSRNGILGIDYQLDRNSSKIVSCAELGKQTVTTANSMFNPLQNISNSQYFSKQQSFQVAMNTTSSSIKSFLKSDANKPEADPASANVPFFCSAADVNTGKWDFAISDNELFVDIFSKNQACNRALAKCKKESGGNCSITNFGRWEEQRPAVALFDCAAEEASGSTGTEKNQKKYPPEKIYEDGNIKENDLKEFANKQVVKQDGKPFDYCVLRIFNEGQVSVTQPAYYVEAYGENKTALAFSKEGTKQQVVLASVSSQEDINDYLKVVLGEDGYKFYSDQGSQIKYGDNGKGEKIIAFVVKGTAEFQLLKRDAEGNRLRYDAPTFNQGQGIILNVDSGVTQEIKVNQCNSSLSKCHPIDPPTKTLTGKGFRIEVPLGWKIVDDAKPLRNDDENYVTVSEAINNVRQKDAQLANAYVDASFTRFQDEVKEPKFAQSLRKQLESYIDSPDKFIVTDFKAALGIGQVSLSEQDFKTFVGNFRQQAENNTTRFLENQPDYTQELTWSGRDAIKLQFKLNLDTPNGELKEMSYLVYLINGLRDSKDLINSYYVVNLIVPQSLAESYDQTFKGIIDSFQPVSEKNTQLQYPQKGIPSQSPY